MSGNTAINVQVALPTELHVFANVAGVEPATHRSLNEVTSIYTTDRMILEKTNMIVNHCY